MFKLMRKVDGEWYLWGTYSLSDPEKAIKAAFYLGQNSNAEDVMIVPVEEEKKDV